MKKFKKSTEDQPAKDLIFMTDEIKDLVYPKPDFADVANEGLRKALEMYLRVLMRAVQAVFEMNSVYEDAVVIRKMGRRYPWRPVHIRKSEHLKMVWFQHINLCYLFEEKVKLLRTQCRHLGKIGKVVLGRDFDDAHLQSIQSRIKVQLGKHIRARGQTFHEWYQGHEGLLNYSAIELAHRFEPDKFEGIGKFYWLVRMQICEEIDETLGFMQEVISNIAKHDLPTIVECSQQLKRIWKSSSEKPANSDGHIVGAAA